MTYLSGIGLFLDSVNSNWDSFSDERSFVGDDLQDELKISGEIGIEFVYIFTGVILRHWEEESIGTWSWMARNELDTLVAVLSLLVEHALDFLLTDDSTINHGDCEFVESFEIQFSQNTLLDIDVCGVQFCVDFEDFFTLVHVVQVHDAWEWLKWSLHLSIVRKLSENCSTYVVSELDFDFGCSLVCAVNCDISVDNVLDGVHEPVVGLWKHLELTVTLRWFKLEAEISLDGTISVEIRDNLLCMLEEVFSVQTGKLRHHIYRLLAGGWEVHTKSLKLKSIDLLLDTSDQNFTFNNIL